MGDPTLGAAALDGPGADGPILAFLRVLADRPDGERIGVALAEGLLRECSPTQVSAYFLDPTGEWLEERAHFAAPDQWPDEFARVPVGLPLPLTEVVRTGEAGAWTMAEAAEAYPFIAGWVLGQPHRADEQVIVVPIRRAGKPVGGLLVALPTTVERTWRLRVLMDAAATALAVWSGEGQPGARPRSTTRAVSVTERQIRIVDGVARGLSNSQIAAELTVSAGTVKADLGRLYRMFGVSDREALPGLVGRTD